VTDTACLIFQPITTSKADSVETLDQIDTHNVRYDAVCG
jgi:hypothetical protein